jgi:hypothetical protein
MSGNFEDDERINLALNSEFDSAFLNCLEDDDAPEKEDALEGETSDFSHSPARPSSPVGEIHRLPSFFMNDRGDGGVNNHEEDNSNNNNSSSAMNGISPHGILALPVAAAGQPSTPSLDNNNNNNVSIPSQMHPMAISSSASCPPVNSYMNNAGVVGNAPSAPSVNVPGPPDPNMTAALQAAFAASIMQLNANPAFNPALIPLAFNAMSAGVDLSNFLPQFQGSNAAGAPSVAQSLNAVAPPPVSTVTAAKHTSKKTSKASGRSSKRRRNETSPSSNKRPKGKRGQRETKQQQQPPFHIFDAPVELRQSFIQAQRSHGLPVLEDDNSYHFGMTVNGFHPQRSLDEPFLYKLLTANGRPLPDPVPVIDARHADAGSKRLKNAKEQKRAHRISELIDQLRVKMEKGGWKVGIKSKFLTLSS